MQVSETRWIFLSQVKVKKKKMKTPQQHFDSAYVDIKSDYLIIHNVLVSKGLLCFI